MAGTFVIRVLRLAPIQYGRIAGFAMKSISGVTLDVSQQRNRISNSLQREH